MNRSSGHGHVLIRGGASLAEEKGRCQHPGFKLTVLKKGVRSKLAHCGTVRERWSGFGEGLHSTFNIILANFDLYQMVIITSSDSFYWFSDLKTCD